MKYILLLFSFLLFNPGHLLSQIMESFEFDGINRTYILDLPLEYELYEQLPLVLNFHGFTSNNHQQRLYSNMTAVADTGIFIVCYPQGIDNAWNVGWTFGSNEDDVGFVNALIDTLASNYKVNLDAVFATGMSNGGFMSYKLACELNDRIKAIASVAGSIHTPEVQNCNPENPIPVMQIHGTADDVVLYNGNLLINIGIEDLIDNWVLWNDCLSESDTILVSNTAPNDGTTAQRIEYKDCGENSQIVFYKIFGGGHTWPGASIDIGVTSQDIDASVEIWNFFRQYTSSLVVSNHVALDGQLSITVTPNPFHDQINIDFGNGSLRRIQVFNSFGQLIADIAPAGDSKFQIQTNRFPAGIYFVKVETAQGNEVFKMVKQ